MSAADDALAELTEQLRGCALLAYGAGLHTLADSMLGLQDVLTDRTLRLRETDGRAMMHTLAGFEGILVDLAVPDDAGLDELRGAMAAAHTAARELAELLEHPAKLYVVRS